MSNVSYKLLPVDRHNLFDDLVDSKQYGHDDDGHVVDAVVHDGQIDENQDGHGDDGHVVDADVHDGHVDDAQFDAADDSES